MKTLDFLIVGAMKAGTSSLAYILGNHKDIHIPAKEIFYFSDTKNYNKGIEWYHNHFDWRHKIQGEKTATYHYLPGCADKIYSYNPDIKLIWIFRNPVDRSYSQYWHAQKQGIEPRSFKRAIDDELNGNTKNLWNLYLKRSLYFEQVDHYLKYFNKDQLYFMTFEDLLTDATKEIDKLLAFLNADKYDGFEIAKKPKNVTNISAYPKSLYKIRNVMGQSKLFRLIKYFLQKREEGYVPMEPDDKLSLENYFREPNRKLADIINLDLSKWE